MKEATALYKPHGKEEIWGHKLGYLVVDNAEVDTKIKEGWFKTPQEAIDVKNNIDTKSKPTKSELAQKAEQDANKG